jgi:CheY-like chemotaxis protein
MMAHSTLRDGRCVVLCVDDEPNALILRKLVLQRAGYEVITASSGKQALEVAESRPIDLLLSDQLMPGMTGTQLAKEIRIIAPKARIVLISGVNEMPADASVADVFLSKIEGPDALCNTVASALADR